MTQQMGALLPICAQEPFNADGLQSCLAIYTAYAITAFQSDQCLHLLESRSHWSLFRDTVQQKIQVTPETTPHFYLNIEARFLKQ